MSGIINGAVSIAFFIGVFGLTIPAPVAALGRDCLPQAFMVSLMSSLIPPLLLRRTHAVSVRLVVVRALALAIVGGAIAGGGAYLACRSSGATLPTMHALALKSIFGAAIGVIVTPLAILPILRSTVTR